MRGLILVLQNLLIFLDWYTAIEYLISKVWEVLGESFELLLDLEGQFSGVTHDEGGRWLGVIIQLLQDGEDEDGGLSETGYSLAEDITTIVGLRNALLLDL